MTQVKGNKQRTAEIICKLKSSANRKTKEKYTWK